MKGLKSKGFPKIGMRLALALVAVAAAACAISPVASASSAGSVGYHTGGIFGCDTFNHQLVDWQDPQVYAVNAHYGSGNDFQHVAFRVYLYDATTGQAIPYSGGWHTSWSAYYSPAVDSVPAMFDLAPGDPIVTFSGARRISYMIYTLWYDSPVTSFYSATHNQVTGWTWEYGGTCQI